MNDAFHLFDVGRVPVFGNRAWLLILLYMLISSAPDYARGVIWLVCVEASIVVHELGHAAAASYYKLQPSILLHGWGGFTIHRPAPTDKKDAVIVAAGPAAGFLFGVAVFGAVSLANVLAPGWTANGPMVAYAASSLLYVNLFWTFVNLLPMFPLDGGLLFRLGVSRWLSPRTTHRVVHVTGLLFSAGWVVYGLSSGSVFLAILGGFFAWKNFAILSGRAAPPRLRPAGNGSEPALLKDARAAFAAGDPREAARLVHQLRALGTIEPEFLPVAMEVLVVADAACERWDEVASYAPHARRTPPVVAAHVRALTRLGKADAAREILAREGDRLASDLRAELSAALAA